MRATKKFKYNLILGILHFLSFLIKKDKNIWVFGERRGTEFKGNAKYLFLHILEKQTDKVRPIWLTKSKYVYNELKKIGGEVYFINRIQALYFGLIAKVFVFTHERQDVSNYAKRGALFVNLYHGMPFKKFSVNRKDQLDIATSEFTKKYRYELFHIPNIAITGEPRDEIFYKKISKKEILEKYELDFCKDKKIISYLPTFRVNRNNYKVVFSNHPEIENLSDIIILEKSHPTDREIACGAKSKYKNVINISGMDIDTQELLLITDILITDYSTSFVDFLLTDKPIIFYAFDQEEYLKSQEIFYDYDEIIPGAKAINETELYNCIRKNLENPDYLKEKREEIRQKFHKFTDGNFSQRVFEEINKNI